MISHKNYYQKESALISASQSNQNTLGCLNLENKLFEFRPYNSNIEALRYCYHKRDIWE
jgi:hypothetical protein